MSFQFNELYPDATDEQKWDQIRLWRNAELSQTDWTQLSDAPVDKLVWAEYRQALRDLPKKGLKADKVDLPVKPA
jgi:hypothetical protein